MHDDLEAFLNTLGPNDEMYLISKFSSKKNYDWGHIFKIHFNSLLNFFHNVQDDCNYPLTYHFHNGNELNKDNQKDKDDK